MPLLLRRIDKVPSCCRCGCCKEAYWRGYLRAALRWRRDPVWRPAEHTVFNCSKSLYAAKGTHYGRLRAVC